MYQRHSGPQRAWQSWLPAADPAAGVARQATREVLARGS